MSRDSDTCSTELAHSFHGVGLQMVKTAFDEIRFNEKGNGVTLIKHLSRKVQDHG
jgi:hypothetical protein